MKKTTANQMSPVTDCGIQNWLFSRRKVTLVEKEKALLKQITSGIEAMHAEVEGYGSDEVHIEHLDHFRGQVDTMRSIM